MRGVWTALVTPFTDAGELDLASYRKILNDQKEAGVTGVIPCGTTGESPTLSTDEKKKLIEIALEEMRGSGVGVMAGTGSNSTQNTIEFSRWASEAGVQGLLVVTPYYNKPTQAGLDAHFRAVADAVSCDIMLYNVPGRTGVGMTAETIASLASHPKIRAVKEATGNVAFTSEILDQLSTQKKILSVLSGDDACFLPSLAVGGSGVVSVASNLFPRAMVRIHKLMEAGKAQEAKEIHQKLYPLFRDLFIESNPGPIKFAMSFSGWCKNTLRLPLVPISKSTETKVLQSLKQSGIEPGRPA